MMFWILIVALALAGLLFCGMLYWIGWGKGDRIVIFIEGGSVQDVVTSRPTEVLVIDLDVASEETDDCIDIPDEDRRGYPIEMTAITDPAYIRKIMAASQVEGESTCRVCGCTWRKPCEGGCYWVEKDLCSSCSDEPKQGLGLMNL